MKIHVSASCKEILDILGGWDLERRGVQTVMVNEYYANLVLFLINLMSEYRSTSFVVVFYSVIIIFRGQLKSKRIF